MQIKPLQIPSDPDKTLYLREATVADCEYFAETDDSAEEVMATQVLELLQCVPEKYVNPRLMTADDRRMAAFWYYVSTNTDMTLHAPYQCPHCGEQHDPLIDLQAIGMRYTPIMGRAYRTIEHDGCELIVIPRNGFLMEELEGLRAQIDSKAPSKMLAIIERHDVVGTLTFKNAPDNSRDNQIEAMEAWVRALPLSSYQLLKQKRDAALDSMRHGLRTRVVDGQLNLITDHIQCENLKEDAGATTTLLIPFRLGEMLPRLLA